MRVTKVLAKELEAGDYIIERSLNGRRVGRHVCEVQIYRNRVEVVFDLSATRAQAAGFERKKFSRTQRVVVVPR